jgi:hypothetical protein
MEYSWGKVREIQQALYALAGEPVRQKGFETRLRMPGGSVA